MVYDLGVSGSSTACAMVKLNGIVIFTPDGLGMWSSNGIVHSARSKLATVTDDIAVLFSPDFARSSPVTTRSLAVRTAFTAWNCGQPMARSPGREW